jgi:single-stranded-DNA-specific exonuclease
MLLHRGIDSPEKLRLFLEPPHTLPHSPLRLAGMDLALQRLYRAIGQGERVGIFGDFDVDGVAGTAIIAEGLGSLGAQVVPYLPNRIGEGHGLSIPGVEGLIAQGVSLIVTVDCGVSSRTEISHARRLGADVIVTDHHIPHGGLPEAVAVINPKVPGGGYPFPHLCGAGLAFKLAQGLHEFFGSAVGGWADSLLELAALGTIADLVPLVDENRYLVQRGLAALSQTQRPGLQALYRNAGVKPNTLNAESVSFQIAPRLNSPGRIGHAQDSYRLLTTGSLIEAEALASRLEALNQERRSLSEVAFTAACEQVARQATSAGLPPLLMVYDNAIHRGVAGLVAGRLAETFHRPAVVLATEDGYLVASGRSIPQFDLFAAFTACQDLFVRFGGHSRAAGFTLPLDKLPQFKERMSTIAEEDLGDRALAPTLDIDAEVKLAELGGDLAGWLSTLEPFGPGNPQPLFLSRKLSVLEARSMGSEAQHLRLRLSQDSGEAWPAVAFNQAGRWVRGTLYLDLVYSVAIDHWRGPEALTLRVQDFRPSPDPFR